MGLASKRLYINPNLMEDAAFNFDTAPTGIIPLYTRTGFTGTHPPITGKAIYGYLATYRSGETASSTGISIQHFIAGINFWSRTLYPGSGWSAWNNFGCKITNINIGTMTLPSNGYKKLEPSLFPSDLNEFLILSIDGYSTLTSGAALNVCGNAPDYAYVFGTANATVTGLSLRLLYR